METQNPWIYLVLYFAGLIAGIMNTVGGGGSVLTLPALIFAGIAERSANATNRIGILAQNAIAIWQFRKKGIKEDSLSLRLILAGLPGAWLGSELADRIPDEQFKLLLGWLMLGLLVLIVLRPKLHFIELTAETTLWDSLNLKKKHILLLVFFVLGIYMGFLQAGGGIMILIALGFLVQLDLVRGNYIKLVFIFIMQIFSVAVFMKNSVPIQWLAGITLFLGQSSGAYIGSWVALEKGEKWIIVTLVLCILASSGKLLEFY